MRATGIVRRIDDLGRVVIPKEIRRTLKIKEGDPLEIFVDAGRNEVTFRRYSPVGEKDWDTANIVLGALLGNVPYALYNFLNSKQVGAQPLPPNLDADAIPDDYALYEIEDDENYYGAFLVHNEHNEDNATLAQATLLALFQKGEE